MTYDKNNPYFPSSSNSWYSSVNLVQIVNAILKDVPKRCAETRIRCTHKAYPPHTVVNTARFCPEPANRTEGFMHSKSASAGALVEWFLRQKRCLRECLGLDERVFGVTLCGFFMFFTPSGLSQLLDAAFCVHFGFPGACPSSTVLSFCTHQTPHYRTYPQLCARSRPFACIPTQANNKENTDNKNNINKCIILHRLPIIVKLIATWP